MYTPSLFLERSGSGPGLATFTEVTIANFAQVRAVHSGRTHDGGFIRVDPPLNTSGRFPRGGVAFRMLLVEGPPPLLTFADSRFPLQLASFDRPGSGDFPQADYTRLGVPHSRDLRITADGQQYTAMVMIGPRASSRSRRELAEVIASLSFPRLRPGTEVGDELAVLGPASSYPVGSFTLVHARGLICNGSVNRCHWGIAPFYLVHAPGRLSFPDLLPCVPARACTAQGGFYAIGWTWEDIFGGYRSGCDLRLDPQDDQFYCTNSAARWDRVGHVITPPAGTRLNDPLQFTLAKFAWDGHVVMVPGLDENPPTAAATRLLWADWRTQHSETDPGGRAGAQTRVFRTADHQLSFRYPASWRAYTFHWTAMQFDLIVYLSNQRLHQPCTTRYHSYSTTVTCRQPVRHLFPGAILASWWEGGNPAWSFGRVPGTPLRVDGRPARLQVARSGCGIGADELLDVIIAIPRNTDNYDEFRACIRGPGTTRLERAARALLRSVQFASPRQSL